MKRYATTMAAVMLLAAGSATADATAVAPHPVEAMFPLDAVRLDGGPLKAQQEQNRKYLLRLDPDKLLSRFRSEAGLEPKAKPYGGWEAPGRPDLAGHILGFYLSGASMMLEATGDEELKRRLLYIADELEAVQDAHGDGCAYAFTDGRKVFDEIASGKIVVTPRPKTEYASMINGRFEPVYTLNKVLLGLYRACVATGDEKVRRVFLRLSCWFGEKILDRLDDDQMKKMLDCEHGSLPESFADAYRMTGEAKYRHWARRLCHERILEPLSNGDRRKLDFHHANNEIPKFTAAERVYRITGEDWLHRAATNAMYAFMHDYAFANGGNAYDEHLFPTNAFESKFQRLAGPESCGSINMMRLAEALFEMEPSADKVDFYERLLFDHILSTHDPFKGLTVYHTPTRWGASRTYSREFDAMWCCTGTGFEAPGKYAQMIYTYSADGDGAAEGSPAVRVNLFAPSTLDWSETGVRLRQETAFPYGETSCVKVEKIGGKAKFTVKIRRPSWAGDGFAVYVNGETASVQQQDYVSTAREREKSEQRQDYVSITREWKEGDRIDIEFPMSLRAEPLPGSRNYAAFFYGPVLLVGDLGSEGVDRRDYVPPLEAGDRTPSFVWSNKFGKRIPMASLPADALANPAAYLERTAVSPLAFSLKGTEIMLVPIFALHYSRYAMYWRLMGEEETRDYAAMQTTEAEYAKRAVDSVVPGDRDSESKHRMKESNSCRGENVYGGTYSWRGTERGGGFFSYRLETGGKPATLVARYRVCETGRRAFDVQVEGKTIFTEDLKDSGKRGFFFREMPIPPELTAGKKEVEVRFVPKKDNIAGGLFGLWLMEK